VYCYLTQAISSFEVHGENYENFSLLPQTLSNVVMQLWMALYTCACWHPQKRLLFAIDPALMV
jgi:hypothetical protein